MSIEGNARENTSLQELRGKVQSIPQTDETLSLRGYSADAKAVGDALAEKTNKKDIIDNLSSDATDRPLSAYQGAVLKKMIGDVNLSEAGTVGYDNASSGLSATNMQSAIDEVAETSKNALPKTGGMIEGTLQVRNADNGHGVVAKNNSATTDYGTYVADVTKGGKSAKVSVSAELNLLTFTDTDGQIRDIFHEGNKPFGSYTGNGSANEREIDTKGLGRLIMVYNTNFFSLVFPEGALVIKTSDKSIDFFPSTKVYYLNGKLGLNLSNEAFNKSGETYYYQAI
jgi:hypothetical protein